MSLNYYGEKLAFSVSPYFAHATTDLNAVGGRQDMSFFAGSASVTGLLPGGLVLQGSGSWQVASQLLVPGDQLFQIGGASTVRGYDANAAAGGSGYYGSVELHKDLSSVFKGLDLFAFVDHGQVFSTSPASTSLTGIGGGVSYSFGQRASFTVTGAFPVGEKLAGQPDFTLFGRLVVKAF